MDKGEDKKDGVYHIDVKFKSCGNGSKSGPWIKLDLAEEEDLEALKNQIGNGFHMVLVPVDQGDSKPPQDTLTKEITADQMDEWSVVIPASRVEGEIFMNELRDRRPVAQKIPDFKKKRDAAKIAEGDKEKPLSCQAHFMIEQHSFWDYSNELHGGTISSYDEADRYLKLRLHIDTKTDLDKGNLYLQNTFLGIQSNWRRWVNSREGRR